MSIILSVFIYDFYYVTKLNLRWKSHDYQFSWFSRLDVLTFYPTISHWLRIWGLIIYVIFYSSYGNTASYKGRVTSCELGVTSSELKAVWVEIEKCDLKSNPLVSSSNPWVRIHELRVKFIIY